MEEITKITSPSNSYIKALYKLKDKKTRKQENKLIVEGAHLVEEAYKAHALLEILTTNDKYITKYKDIKIIKVSEEIIKKLSDTTTPQDILGIAKISEYAIDFTKIKHVLILDDVKDPGNVGTLIRTSLGFNIDLIILSEDSCDIYNSKTIRSSQGAIFSVPCIYSALEPILETLKKHNIKTISTSLDASISITDIGKPDKYAIILGNEANGVRDIIQEKADINVIIPINKKLESLNVAIAGAILMYEVNKWK